MKGFWRLLNLEKKGLGIKQLVKSALTEFQSIKLMKIPESQLVVIQPRRNNNIIESF